MVRKGIISSIDSSGKASVILSDMDDTVTAMLPIMNYSPGYQVKDIVIVAFFGSDLKDGAILGKIGGG